MSKSLSPLAKKKLVIAALEDIKAHDIQALDVRKLTSVFECQAAGGFRRPARHVMRAQRTA